MRRFLAVVAFASGFFFSAQSFAATVDSIHGQVLLNSGAGYRVVVGTMEAKVGDSVMVNPGGSARLVYSDGCMVKVEPGSVVAVAPESQSPCKTRSGASGLGASEGGACGLKDECPEEPVDHTRLILGAELVAGIVAVCVVSFCDDSASRH